MGVLAQVVVAGTQKCEVLVLQPLQEGDSLVARACGQRAPRGGIAGGTDTLAHGLPVVHGGAYVGEHLVQFGCQRVTFGAADDTVTFDHDEGFHLARGGRASGGVGATDVHHAPGITPGHLQ